MEKILSHPIDSAIFPEDTDFMNALIKVSLENTISFSIYRLPGDFSLFFIADFSKSPVRMNKEIEKEQGFVFNPFDTSFPSFFIRANILINIKSRSYQYQQESETQAKHFLQEVHEAPSRETKSSASMLPALVKIPDCNAEDFREKVIKAIQSIESGEFKKVVLARTKEIPLSDNFNFASAFSELCKDSNAFVSLTHIPEEGIWFGASPELLLSIDRNKKFKTVALAGTQTFSNLQEISKAVWTQKEIEEQALVSRYIINCFKTIRLREYEEDGPRTIRAGNLIHLKTTFSVNMNEVDFPSLGSTMLELLHPTSAVCGMPKDKATYFLQQNEDLDRKFYSGYLGPVNLENETHIFVNIRCAEVGKDSARIYSGAGITLESDPDKEFAETELKMKMMERIISGKSI